MATHHYHRATDTPTIDTVSSGKTNLHAWNHSRDLRILLRRNSFSTDIPNRRNDDQAKRDTCPDGRNDRHPSREGRSQIKSNPLPHVTISVGGIHSSAKNDRRKLSSVVNLGNCHKGLPAHGFEPDH